MEMTYTLSIDFPDGTTRKYNIINEFTVGLDPRNDLVLLDQNIKAQHFCFKEFNGVLSLQYFGKDNVTTLSGMPLKTNKHYILSDNDLLKIGLIKIRVIQNHKSNEPKEQIAQAPKINNTVLDFQPSPKVKKAHFNFSLYLESFPFHVYALLIDLFMPYFFISFIFPKYYLHKSAFYILKNYLNSIHLPFPYIYLFSFYLTHLSFNLIFGNSLGSFFIGLDYPHTSVIKSRFKSIFFSLLSPLVLPLFFTGKIPTYSTFQSLKRKVLIPFFLVFILGSYFFLPDIYAGNVTTTILPKPILVDSQSSLYQTNSKLLEISYNHFIPNEFLITFNLSEINPTINFFDLKHEENISFTLIDRINVEEFYQRIYFHNPLFPILFVENKSKFQIKKDIIDILKFNPSEIFNAYQKSGPFINYRSILKNDFFKYLNQANLVINLNSYSSSSPLFLLSSASEKILFITTKETIFVLKIFNNNAEDIFYKLETTFLNNIKDISVSVPLLSNEYNFLSGFDGIITHQDSLVLTYYEALAKRIEKITDQNLKEKLFLELNRNSRWKFPRSENENSRSSKRTLSIPTSTRRQKYKSKSRRH